MAATGSRKAQGTTGKETLLFSPVQPVLFVLGAFIALMVLSGWGMSISTDHIVRNACLRELVASPWPVVFPTETS
ncbi:MAG: hypothetical protein ACLT8E_10250 [Akkermansia sp.]